MTAFNPGQSPPPVRTPIRIAAQSTDLAATPCRHTRVHPIQFSGALHFRTDCPQAASKDRCRGEMETERTSPTSRVRPARPLAPRRFSRRPFRVAGRLDRANRAKDSAAASLDDVTSLEGRDL